MARWPLQDLHFVPRPRRGHRRRRRCHRVIKTLRAGKGADAYYRPTRHQRLGPLLCCSFWERAPLIASTVSVPAPQQLQPTSQGQTPLTSAATWEAPLKGTQIPPLPACSPERLRCSDPSHSDRSTPFAQKREVGATIASSAQVPVSWRAPGWPRRQRVESGPGAGAGCRPMSVCVLRAVDGDTVDAFEEPNKYFSI